MHISSLVPIVQDMVNIYGLPFSLIFHVGANDIGLGPTRKVLEHLMFASYIVSKMLPNTLLAYSQMLPRKNWRYNTLRSMERSRRRINRGIRTYFFKSNAPVIKHTDLQDGHQSLYNSDGVHLSFLGNDIFINAIQSFLEHYI